eukprot:TRINITY_DN27763_c0_g1_i1.p1 TRINITY_DN27763_c0_g1~~TRINITY_DN27763_c0_g1_i1.p1  ORF type:complete len:272 (+),score=32.26 TRINITY_DN27763_c0_g1_i1:74-889(+)
MSEIATSTSTTKVDRGVPVRRLVLVQSYWNNLLGPLVIVVLFVLQIGLIVTRTVGVVKELDEVGLSKFLEKHSEGALVYFHVSDCFHCVKVEPALNQAALQLVRSESAPLAIASVNADTEQAFVKRFGLQRFPAIVWIRPGESIKELGPTNLTTKGIIDFLTAVRHPLVVDAEAPSQYDEITVREEVVKADVPFRFQEVSLRKQALPKLRPPTVPKQSTAGVLSDFTSSRSVYSCFARGAQQTPGSSGVPQTKRRRGKHSRFPVPQFIADR